MSVDNNLRQLGRSSYDKESTNSLAILNLKNQTGKLSKPKKLNKELKKQDSEQSDSSSSSSSD